MKRSFVIISALAISLVTSACTHNTTPPPPSGDMAHREWTPEEHMHMMHMMADTMFDRMDKNHDGVITRREYEEYSRRWFREADTNHDGKLTHAEFIAQMKREKGELMQDMRHKQDKDKGDMNDDNNDNSHGN